MSAQRRAFEVRMRVVTHWSLFGAAVAEVADGGRLRVVEVEEV